MDETYIYLFRKFTKSALWKDKNASRLFTWLLLNVDYKTGTINIGTRELAQKVDLKHRTCYDALTRLRHAAQITHSSPHGTYTTISLVNWAKYQIPKTKPYTPTFKTRNLYKEIKNISNTNVLLGDNSPGSSKALQHGNGQVNQIIEAFRENLGYSPTDRSPRNVAHNMRQIINTFVKNHGVSYEQLKNKPLTFEYIHARVWRWYMKREYAEKTENLDTVKQKMKMYLENQSKQLEKEVNDYAITTEPKDDEEKGEEFGYEAKRGNSEISGYTDSASLSAFPIIALSKTRAD